MAFGPNLAEDLVEEFALALRQLRRRAGSPTFRAMSRREFVSAATLCRAERGWSVPSLEATLAYVRSCHGDEDLWRGQHADLVAAVHEHRWVVFFPWRGFTPDEDDETGELPTAAYLLDRNRVESLATAMQRMRIEAGLTLAEVAARTKRPEIAAQLGGRGLPISTIGDLCNPRHGRVPSKRTLRGYLLAIGAPERAMKSWERTRMTLHAKPSSAMQHTSGRRIPVARTFAEMRMIAELDAIRTRSEFVAALRRLHNSSGLTYREAARRIELNHATICGYVRGQHLPRAHGRNAELFIELLRIGYGIENKAVLNSWSEALRRVAVPPGPKSAKDEVRRRSRQTLELMSSSAVKAPM